MGNSSSITLTMIMKEENGRSMVQYIYNGQIIVTLKGIMKKVSVENGKLIIEGEGLSMDIDPSFKWIKIEDLKISEDGSKIEWFEVPQQVSAEAIAQEIVPDSNGPNSEVSKIGEENVSESSDPVQAYHKKINENGVTIIGHHNIITGNGNKIMGHHNHISGNSNNVVGDNNKTLGDENSIFGDHNKANGKENKATGRHNQMNSPK